MNLRIVILALGIALCLVVDDALNLSLNIALAPPSFFIALVSCMKSMMSMMLVWLNPSLLI